MYDDDHFTSFHFLIFIFVAFIIGYILNKILQVFLFIFIYVDCPQGSKEMPPPVGKMHGEGRGYK